MTKEKAENILSKKCPTKLIQNGVSYKDRYVFLLVNKDEPLATVYDQFYTVDNSGSIGSYNPASDKDRSKFFKLWRESLSEVKI